jgi:hypothetical protein
MLLILNVQQEYKSTSILPFPLIYPYTWRHPLAQADNDKFSAKGEKKMQVPYRNIFFYTGVSKRSQS